MEVKTMTNGSYVRWLEDGTATLESVGGKGASLSRLMAAGLPVPEAFCVTTEAYDLFVTQNGLSASIAEALQGAVADDPETLQTASNRIGVAFSRAEIPADVAAAVAHAYVSLPGNEPAVAVRSSATAEDLPEASFAGQQDSYLNLQGIDDVIVAVTRCWSSLWTARAIGYRLRQSVPQESVHLAVVVQVLVAADAAGVLFTANPMTGSREQMVISAAWGLGEAIVGGVVTPDTLVMDRKQRRVLSREIADKQTMTVRVEGGTKSRPVPAHRRGVCALSDRAALDLMALGERIERLYGAPMDIEWVHSDGALAIVQARPITAMAEKVADALVDWQVPDPKATYARGSLAEHTPSPVSPLFATMGLRIANEETYRLWEEITGLDPGSMFVGDGMYMPINGYVYGAFRLGLKETWQITKMSLSLTGQLMRGSPERWRQGLQALEEAVLPWQSVKVAALAPLDLLEGARTLFRAAMRYYTVIQTTLPAASMAEMAFQRFYNALVKRKRDPEYTEFLFGFETLTVRAEMSLYDIAQWLQEQPALRAYVTVGRIDDLASDLEADEPPSGIPGEDWGAWRARIAAHFGAFGGTAYEFDFSNPTPAEEPTPQLLAIRLFVEGKAESPYERLRTAAVERERAEGATVARLGWPRKGWFAKLLTWAQETGSIREASIAHMGMGHPTIRRLLGELGQRLSQAGAFDSAEGIYWLPEKRLDALTAALEQGRPLPDCREEVDRGLAAWKIALQVTPPVALPKKAWINKLIGGKQAEGKDGKLILKGIGTSSGQVTAPACVLYGPQDFDRMRAGDVLVATTTTPAWTPLFTMASAVVTDIGGPLSHSSIVAREYGIPAVMAARDATRLIESGQLITVDGAKGTVVVG